MAKSRSAKKSVSKVTEVTISGSGLGFCFLDIDEEKFISLTQNGISQSEYEDLIFEVRDQVDHYICAPFVDGTVVELGEQRYVSSWENIKHQLNNQMPLPQIMYGTTYKLFHEDLQRGVSLAVAAFDWQCATVTLQISPWVGYSPPKRVVKLRTSKDQRTLEKGKRFGAL